jgi:hypothetical protein
MPNACYVTAAKAPVGQKAKPPTQEEHASACVAEGDFA